MNPTQIEREKPKMLSVNALNKMAATAARRAAPVFAAEGWTYGRRGTPEAFVPDEVYLAGTIMHLLESAGKPNCGCSRTGRFVVSRWIEEPENEEWATVELILADEP